LNLPGLQDDAFLINAWTLPALYLFYFLHILFRRPTTVISIGVLAFGKDPTGCASAMHSPFILSGGCQIHSAEPLVLYFMSSTPKMVDPRSIVGGDIVISDNDERRQEGDYSRSVR